MRRLFCKNCNKMRWCREVKSAPRQAKIGGQDVEFRLTHIECVKCRHAVVDDELAELNRVLKEILNK